MAWDGAAIGGNGLAPPSLVLWDFLVAVPTDVSAATGINSSGQIVGIANGHAVV